MAPTRWWSNLGQRIVWYPGQRRYSRRELLADAVINVVGLASGCVGVAILLSRPTVAALPSSVRACVCVYGVAVVSMLACSAAWNSLAWRPESVRLLKFADHVGIVLKIVGSGTTPLKIAGCDRTLVATWIFALSSIGQKGLRPSELGPVQLTCFLVMGWGPTLVWREMVAVLPRRAVVLGVAAGLAYTAGTVPLSLSRLEGHTALWHAFVMLGSGLIFLAHWEMVDALADGVTSN
jgi:hemolysin III